MREGEYGAVLGDPIEGELLGRLAPLITFESFD